MRSGKNHAGNECTYSLFFADDTTLFAKFRSAIRDMIVVIKEELDRCEGCGIIPPSSACVSAFYGAVVGRSCSLVSEFGNRQGHCEVNCPLR